MGKTGSALLKYPYTNTNARNTNKQPAKPNLFIEIAILKEVFSGIACSKKATTIIAITIL